MKVSWDDYSQYMEKMIETTNQWWLNHRTPPVFTIFRMNAPQETTFWVSPTGLLRDLRVTRGRLTPWRGWANETAGIEQHIFVGLETQTNMINVTKHTHTHMVTYGHIWSHMYICTGARSSCLGHLYQKSICICMYISIYLYWFITGNGGDLQEWGFHPPVIYKIDDWFLLVVTIVYE